MTVWHPEDSANTQQVDYSIIKQDDREWSLGIRIVILKQLSKMLLQSVSILWKDFIKVVATWECMRE
jgi:hypothetical protein